MIEIKNYKLNNNKNHKLLKLHLKLVNKHLMKFRC